MGKRKKFRNCKLGHKEGAETSRKELLNMQMK